MVAKVNDNWDLAGNGIGSTTHIVLVDTTATTVEAAVKELLVTHTIAGISGAYLAVQGDATPAAADTSVVVSFA